MMVIFVGNAVVIAAMNVKLLEKICAEGTLSRVDVFIRMF